MSHWIFSSRAPSTDPKLAFNSNTVQHLEFIFQDFKPYVLALDITNANCSMQFNRRVFQTELEGRLQKNKLYHIGVQGVFNPPLVYHPNTSILINEPLQLAPSTATQTLASNSNARPPVQNQGAITLTPPPTPPRLENSPQASAPVLMVIKLSSHAIVPQKDANSNSLKIFAPFDFYIPPNSVFNLKLGYALISPPSFCLKLELTVPDKNVYLKESVATCGFYEPLVLTFCNSDPSQLVYITRNSLIATVTCHRIFPTSVLLLEHVLDPILDIDSSTNASSDGTSTTGGNNTSNTRSFLERDPSDPKDVPPTKKTSI
ncbi:hypothetical protein V9T40_001623 [Parthenolecanium corni]|uniref:Uncharacterized protein n=1 Tax=Parthenolecanium corni TaxID=536013 RepID=A0AAN9TMX6_9HEMI